MDTHGRWEDEEIWQNITGDQKKQGKSKLTNIMDMIKEDFAGELIEALSNKRLIPCYKILLGGDKIM